MGNGMPVAIQRCDRFVARTMNWLYDHLRHVPRYDSIVVCDEIENREEFPQLTAWKLNNDSLAHSIWRRMSGRDTRPLYARRLRRIRPRVLHSHFGYVAVEDYSLWKSIDIPWVIGFYGADVYSLGRQKEWRERYRAVFEACTRVLALGPVMARHLEQLGCPAEKVLVHPLGISVEDLPAVPRPYSRGSPLKVLFAGTFREKKGLQYALNAIATVRRMGYAVEMQLVAEAANKPGDRETEAAALQLIKDLNIADIVVRHSFLAFRNLLDLSYQCHVFLAPSVTAGDGDSEGTPFVLQQMMATAMPAVATRHSDIPYVFGPLEHLLVDERDSQGITDRLLRYAENPTLLLEHGELLRKRMLEHFDVRRCAERLSDIYDACG
jgi:colanic acid/amylovoran biosynthesis glycosyltransferase